MKKELPVLGIQAHHIGRQQIGGEIRREPQNVLADAPGRAGPAIGFHDVSTRTGIPRQGSLLEKVADLARWPCADPPTRADKRRRKTQYCCREDMDLKS